VTCRSLYVTTNPDCCRREPHSQHHLDSAVMSTTPSEKGGRQPLDAAVTPEAKKIAAASISSGSDGSHQYVTGEVFAQGGEIQYYEPIAEYEGRHRYDPTAQWTKAEEKRLIRRVRVNICLLCSQFFPGLLSLLAVIYVDRPLEVCVLAASQCPVSEQAVLLMGLDHMLDLNTMFPNQCFKAPKSHDIAHCRGDGAPCDLSCRARALAINPDDDVHQREQEGDAKRMKI
jgi:hypothetical protein